MNLKRDSFSALILVITLMSGSAFAGVNEAPRCVDIISESAPARPSFEVLREGDTGVETAERVISRGYSGQLKLSDGTVKDVTFIASEIRDGIEQLLFFEEGSSFDIIRVNKSDLGITAGEFNPKDLILAASYQARDETCAAHAMASCVIVTKPGFMSLYKNDQHEALPKVRAKLIEAAKKAYYSDNWKYQDGVKNFLNSVGIQTKVFTVEHQEGKKELYQLLKDGSPVLLFYYGSFYNSFRTRSNVDEQGSISKVESSKKLFLPSDKDRHDSGHAVLGVGLIETPKSKKIMVLDSATGQLELWDWSLIDKIKNPATLAVHVPRDQRQAETRLVLDETMAIAQRYDLQFGSWLRKNLDRIEEVKNLEDWFPKQRVSGHWFVMKRLINQVKSGKPQIESGRITSIGKDKDGTPFFNFISGSKGAISERTILLTEIDSFYVVKPPAQTPNQTKLFQQVLTEGRVGDAIELDWQYKPSHSPTRIKGILYAKTQSGWEIYDRHLNAKVVLNSIEMIELISFKPSKQNWTQQAPYIAEAHFSEMLSIYKLEGKSSEYITREGQRLLESKKLVQLAFKADLHSSFDTSTLKIGSKVLIQTAAGYLIHFKDEGFPEGRTVAEGTVLSVSKDELTVAFPYSGEVTFALESVKAIFISKSTQ